ncbi:MAG: choline-phosphate cytidylyltransferase [Marteilia pararefringens]
MSSNIDIKCKEQYFVPNPYREFDFSCLNIDFVAHDDAPYKSASNQKGEIEDIYAFLKTKDKFLATKRGEISTTDLLVKIISRYEEYVMRNLNRGVNRQEMNVSWLRLSLIRVRSFISKLFGSLLFLK